MGFFKNRNGSSKTKKYLCIALGIADLSAFVIAAIVEGLQTAILITAAVCFISLIIGFFILSASYILAAACFAGWIIIATGAFEPVTAFFAVACGIGSIALFLSICFTANKEAHMQKILDDWEIITYIGETSGDDYGARVWSSSSSIEARRHLSKDDVLMDGETVMVTYEGRTYPLVSGTVLKSDIIKENRQHEWWACTTRYVRLEKITADE